MESVCNGYMCILVFVKLIGCNGIAEMYAGLEEGGEMVLHRSMFKLGVHLPLVYVHSSICETYWV